MNQDLRIVFQDSDGKTIPAVYCEDLFADQIEAEKNGTTPDSQFYTETYSSHDASDFFKWICPNITSTNIMALRKLDNLNANIYNCLAGKLFDPDFEAETECSSTKDLKEYW